MTDYIEWLLEEDEDAGETVSLSETGSLNAIPALRQAVRAARASDAAQSEPSASARESWEDAAAKALVREELALASSSGAREDEDGATTPAAGERSRAALLEALSSVRIQSGGASGLAQRLARADRAAVYIDRAQSGGTISILEDRSAGSAPDLKALDQYFQRDARRYDGGFPLY